MNYKVIYLSVSYKLLHPNGKILSTHQLRESYQLDKPYSEIISLKNISHIDDKIKETIELEIKELKLIDETLRTVLLEIHHVEIDTVVNNRIENLTRNDDEKIKELFQSLPFMFLNIESCYTSWVQ